MGLEGRSSIGRYAVLERVGQGAMGVVYRGRDTVLDREVAIKLLAGDFAADEEARARFFREARAAARLQHRNIVTVFEYGDEDGTPFMVSEFLRGTDLASRMESAPPLSLEAKLDIVAQLCTGLQFAHQQGVVHRDIKPRNIWLLDDGGVKLLDFGIAKLAASTMTDAASMADTASYMAPEQLKGEALDGRADIFSAGVVLRELLTGRKVRERAEPWGAGQESDADPVPIEELAPGLPPALVMVVRRAIEKDPENRYRQAGEMAADLQMVRLSLSSASSLELDLDAPGTLVAGPPAESADSGDYLASTVAPTPARAPVRRPLDGWPLHVALVATAAILTGTVVFLWTDSSPHARPADSPPSAAMAGAAAPASTLSSPTPARALRPFRIISQPAGAFVTIDRQPIGQTTPATVQLDDTRNHRLELALDGYGRLETDITPPQIGLGEGRYQLNGPAVSTARSRTTTTVVLTATYPFEVLDGTRLVSAASSTHTLTVAAPLVLRVRASQYFLDQVRNIPGGQANGQRAVRLELPDLGYLSIYGDQFSSCSVALDGLRMDGIPITHKQVVAGTHTLTLRDCEGSRQMPVSVVAGSERKIELGK